MSIRATNFVRRLRGLTSSEKVVAFVLADHDNRNGDGCFASMTTVALEAGFAHRQNASDLVQSLAEKKVIFTDRLSKGRKPTVWRFNYGLNGADPSISLTANRSRTAAVNRSPAAAVENAQPQPTSAATAATQESNRSQEASQPQPSGCREGYLEARVDRSKGKSSSSREVPTDDDDSYEKKMETLYSTHPSFMAWCRSEILSRAEQLGTKVVSPDHYVRAALPSFLEEPESRFRLAISPAVFVPEQKPPAIGRAYGGRGGGVFHSPEVRRLRDLAKSRGFNNTRLGYWCNKTFSERGPCDLSMDQYQTALAHFESLPVVHRSPHTETENVAAVLVRLN